MNNIIATHKKFFEKKEPQVIAKAPIICTLFGAFAESCQGFSLLCCGVHSVIISISKRSDNLIKVYKADGSDRKRFAINALRFRKEDRWSNYVKAVIAVLIKEGHSFVGMDITLDGDGLNSDTTSLSTSLAIATCLAVNELYKLSLRQQDIVRVVHQANTSFNNETCRISDIMTLLNGKDDSVVFFDHQHSTYQFIDFPFIKEKSEFFTVTIDSKIPSAAMRDENIYAHKLTNEALDKLYLHYKDMPRRDIPEKDVASRIIPIDEKYRNVSVFVLRESRFAQEAKNMLEQNQAVLYGRVMNRSEVDLRDKLEITCPEIDWLVKRAVEIDGCKGAHLVFDGNSGSIMLLINESSLALYQEKMEEYGHIFGFVSTWQEFRPTKKAEVLFVK